MEEDTKIILQRQDELLEERRAAIAKEEQEQLARIQQIRQSHEIAYPFVFAFVTIPPTQITFDFGYSFEEIGVNREIAVATLAATRRWIHRSISWGGTREARIQARYGAAQRRPAARKRKGIAEEERWRGEGVREEAEEHGGWARREVQIEVGRDRSAESRFATKVWWYPYISSFSPLFRLLPASSAHLPLMCLSLSNFVYTLLITDGDNMTETDTPILRKCFPSSFLPLFAKKCLVYFHIWTFPDMVVRQAREIAQQRDTIENEVLSKTQSLREQLLARDAQRDRYTSLSSFFSFHLFPFVITWEMH